jgi:SSS family solute:Na+ symporter
MGYIDWLVLLLTLVFVVLYGIYKGKSTQDIDGYYRSGRELPWYVVMLSVMGTQASAITFLSAPGQAYTDGMRFVQYYFGLPLAMIVLCITFIPIFKNLNVYTAYEYLEKRFDRKTRSLAAFLFLLSRALSTGISIYAPSIILSSVLGWNIYLTNCIMGGIVILYSISGGARAVAYTQQLQLIIIFVGLILAGYLIMDMLPADLDFIAALKLGKDFGKMNIITTGMTETGFNWNDRFNIISGVIGGFFLALSYFGTDQSQVGRYLTASSIKESKIGLLMNGMVKVPMQFFILLLGVLVFVYYMFHASPLYFNELATNKLKETSFKSRIIELEEQHKQLAEEKKIHLADFLKNGQAVSKTKLDEVAAKQEVMRTEVKGMIKTSGIAVESSDTNYIFIRFVMDHMPHGLIGLLIAVIFLAAWGSISAALNSLSSSSLIDFHRPFINPNLTDKQEFILSKKYTFLWGLFCVVFAQFATGMGSLIEAVNVLGSWFYGVMLGIFLVAFYVKSVGGKAVFYGAIAGEVVVLSMYFFTDIGWLWLNAIGAIAVLLFSIILQSVGLKNRIAQQ